MKDHNSSEILIYQSKNGMTKIDVTFRDETNVDYNPKSGKSPCVTYCL